MATSGLSYQYATGDGDETIFGFTFGIIEDLIVVGGSPEGVLVYVDGVKKTSGYSITASSKKVTFDSAPAAAAEIKIERSTPQAVADQLTQFTDGAVLSEQDLDNLQLQLLYIALEAHENYEGGELTGGSLSAEKLADDTITSDHLAANSVGTSEIQDDAVTSAKIADGTVIAADIADDSITFADLARTSDLFVGTPDTATDNLIKIDKSTGNLSTGMITATDVYQFNASVQLNQLNQLVPPTDHLDLNEKRIEDLGEPVAAQDAATKAYVDSVSGFNFAQFSGTITQDVLATDTGGVTVLTCTLPSGISKITGINLGINITAITHTLENNEGGGVRAWVALDTDPTAYSRLGASIPHIAAVYDYPQHPQDDPIQDGVIFPYGGQGSGGSIRVPGHTVVLPWYFSDTSSGLFEAPDEFQNAGGTALETATSLLVRIGATNSMYTTFGGLTNEENPWSGAADKITVSITSTVNLIYIPE